MKRILLILACVAALALTVTADRAARVEFARTVADLGTIRSDGGKVKFEYPFKNTGDKALVILSVSNGGCGCTQPEFPKNPIAPGESGKISISFDPTGRRGELNRVIKVRTNGRPATVKLRFKGNILPPR